jgi:hypothetical protein
MDKPLREELTSDRVARVTDLAELQGFAGQPEGVLAGASARLWRARGSSSLRECDRSS